MFADDKSLVLLFDRNDDEFVVFVVVAVVVVDDENAIVVGKFGNALLSIKECSSDGPLVISNDNKFVEGSFSVNRGLGVEGSHVFKIGIVKEDVGDSLGSSYIYVFYRVEERFEDLVVEVILATGSLREGFRADVLNCIVVDVVGTPDYLAAAVVDHSFWLDD